MVGLHKMKKGELLKKCQELQDENQVLKDENQVLKDEKQVLKDELLALKEAPPHAPPMSYIDLFCGIGGPSVHQAQRRRWFSSAFSCGTST